MFRTIVRGKVWLLGAGPGDPELLTVKAARVLASAEVVCFDELVSDAILALAPRSAERIAVGRRAKQSDGARGFRHHDERIHPLVIERALAGKQVVRLKGGDPFVFGRGGEECEELAAARIPFEVVPGISAALGAAASTGIPLTHRDAGAASVTLATAHGAHDEVSAAFASNLPTNGTLVLYMGLGRIAETCALLIAQGRSATTPAAAIASATLPEQRVVEGTLESLPTLVLSAQLRSPTLLIIGEVVARRVISPAEHAPACALAARSA